MKWSKWVNKGYWNQGRFMTQGLSVSSRDASGSYEMSYQDCHKAVSVLFGLLIAIPEEIYQSRFCQIYSNINKIQFFFPSTIYCGYFSLRDLKLCCWKTENGFIYNRKYKLAHTSRSVNDSSQQDMRFFMFIFRHMCFYLFIFAFMVFYAK